MKKLFFFLAFLITFFATSLFSPEEVSAHCDTLDGPVVAAARRALGTNNVNYVLIWVRPENEEEIKKALKKAQSKRKKAKLKDEKEKADIEFFETLVRVHREGEGARYEGIKPAGQIELELALADKAIETGNLDEVLNHILDERSREIVRHLFHRVKEKSGYSVDDIVSGREFIGAYVKFIHTVEKAVKVQKVFLKHHSH